MTEEIKGKKKKERKKERKNNAITALHVVTD